MDRIESDHFYWVAIEFHSVVDLNFGAMMALKFQIFFSVKRDFSGAWKIQTFGSKVRIQIFLRKTAEVLKFGISFVVLDPPVQSK